MKPQWIKKWVIRSCINSKCTGEKRLIIFHCILIFKIKPKNNFFSENANADQNNRHSCMSKKERSHDRHIRETQIATGCSRDACCKGTAPNHSIKFIELIQLINCNINQFMLFISKLARIFIAKITKNQPVIEKPDSNVCYKRRYSSIISRHQTTVPKKKRPKASYQRPQRTLEIVGKRKLGASKFFRYLILPFHSYFLTENTFHHSSKNNKAQKNCACGIFNNSNMKEILS